MAMVAINKWARLSFIYLFWLWSCMRFLQFFIVCPPISNICVCVHRSFERDFFSLSMQMHSLKKKQVNINKVTSESVKKTTELIHELCFRALEMSHIWLVHYLRIEYCDLRISNVINHLNWLQYSEIINENQQFAIANCWFLFCWKTIHDQTCLLGNHIHFVKKIIWFYCVKFHWNEKIHNQLKFELFKCTHWNTYRLEHTLNNHSLIIANCTSFSIIFFLIKFFEVKVNPCERKTITSTKN